MEGENPGRLPIMGRYVNRAKAFTGFFNYFLLATDLGFVHFGEGGRKEYAKTYLPRNVYAYTTSPTDFDHPSICASVLEAYLETRSDPAVGGDSGPRQAHGDERLAHHGTEPGSAFRKLSSGAQPGSMELSQG